MRRVSERMVCNRDCVNCDVTKKIVQCTREQYAALLGLGNIMSYHDLVECGKFPPEIESILKRIEETVPQVMAECCSYRV